MGHLGTAPVICTAAQPRLCGSLTHLRKNVSSSHILSHIQHLTVSLFFLLQLLDLWCLYERTCDSLWGGAKQFSGWLLTLYIPDALILSWSSHVMVSTSFVLNVSAFYFILFLPACSFKEENIWSTSPVRSCFAAASSSFPFPQSVFVLIALDFSLCEREMWHHYSPI